MICPICHGRGQVHGIAHVKGLGTRRVSKPCAECGGMGFSHCCDGHQPSDRDAETEAMNDLAHKGQEWDRD